MWGIGASIFFLIIAILFMKNQVRPIRNLAIAAEQFGKGSDIIDYKESGATEVRQAGLAFNKMRARIRKQIQQRTEMLAAISHDLRTPLTRMKLEIEMMKDKKETDLLKKEVLDMQNMIGEYLEFVKGDTLEFSEEVEIDKILEGICNQFSGPSLKIEKKIKEGINIKLKPSAIKRVFNNILENAKRYASKVLVTLDSDKTYITISIEDNGPGVIEEHYQEIVKPFVRLDSSRSIKTGGVGLGLSIVADIIINHGGTLDFDKSSLGGLKVIIKLPK
jgi:two-component system osmolarity sensor histidine kinase EnvZ